MMHSLTITTIQTHLHWEDRQANLNMLEKKLDSISKKTELIILPEMFSTGFSMQPQKLAETMNGAAVNWMRQQAMQRKIIITGSLIIEEDGKYYNRLIWMLPSGDLGQYDKRHLFSYAEEHRHYSPGSKKLIASVNGWKIMLQVCYDLRFPVWCRQSNDENELHDVMINVANWPDKRSLAWKTLLQARAIENQCYTIGVNRVGKDGNDIYYSGNSMVVDPLGEILYHGESEEDIHTIILQKELLMEIRKQFPFLNDRDEHRMV